MVSARRIPTMIMIVFTLLLAACGANQSSSAPAPTVVSAPTAAPAPTAVPPPTAMAAMAEPTAAPTAAAGMDHGAMQPTAMAGMTMGDSKAPYDAQFIDSMIMHHQGAIAMANQALKEAQKGEIKTLAENIITAQQTEIKQMQEWRSTWYPNLAPTEGMGMAMGDMMISSDTSKSFDLRFIEAMIPHHQGAIEMAKDAQQKAEHTEIKTLAGNIISAQEGEIKQMQDWKKAWFNQ